MIDVPVGYKQTDVGVIPEDWDVTQFKEVAKVVDSLHQTPSFSEDGYPMVRVVDIKIGDLNLKNTLRVSESVFLEFTKNYKPKKNDIVLSRVGSYGVSSFVETDEPFCIGQNTVVIEPKIPSRFLYYVLNSPYIRQQIEDGSYGSGYKSLSLKNIKELLTSLPPTLTEQTAIATALSDVDALLNQLDKLIAKKRDIKQATMQQLLTGKKRLTGFSGEWEVKKLGDVAISISSGKSNTEAKIGSHPIYGSTGIIGYQHHFDYQGNKILVARVGANAGTVNKVSGQYCVSDNTLMITYQNYMSIDFSYYQLIHKNLNSLVFGSGQPLITGGQLKDLLLPCPPLEEQTAIATLLTDMDTEITQLQQRRHKTHALKQGMMQQLLTGKIRLI